MEELCGVSTYASITDTTVVEQYGRGSLNPTTRRVPAPVSHQERPRPNATKMQQPPALEADGFRKFNRSYELNAGKHRLIFQARLLSKRVDRRAGLRPRKAAPRSAAAVESSAAAISPRARRPARSRRRSPQGEGGPLRASYGKPACDDHRERQRQGRRGARSQLKYRKQPHAK